MNDDEPNLRERTRRAVRAEIARAAIPLFVAKGFDATTADEIARAAGISRRSYFRYFESKDEVLAEGLASIGRQIAATLDRRPTGEDPWMSLRRAFDPLLEQAANDPRARALGRLMLSRPALQYGKESSWSTDVGAALQPRLGLPVGDSGLAAHALVASALGCLHAAQTQWLDADDQTDLGALLDAAMSAVRPLGA